jgi:hypothetical protein
VRCRWDDLSLTTRAKAQHHAVLVVIPPVLQSGTGKHAEPSCLDAYMMPLIQDLQRYGPRLPDGLAGMPREWHAMAAASLSHPMSCQREEHGANAEAQCSMTVMPC